MTADNFDHLMLGLINKRPFEIFTIKLHGGEKFEVDHPNATVVRDGVAVFMAPGGRPYWFDHDSVVSIAGVPANVE